MTLSSRAPSLVVPGLTPVPVRKSLIFHIFQADLSVFHAHRLRRVPAEKSSMSVVIKAIWYKGMTFKDPNFVGDGHQGIGHSRELENAVLDPPPAKDLMLVSIKDIHESASLDGQQDTVVDLLSQLVAKDIPEASFPQWLHVSDGDNIKVGIDAPEIPQDTRPHKIRPVLHMLKLRTILCMRRDFNVTDHHAGNLKYLVRPKAAVVMLCGRDG